MAIDKENKKCCKGDGSDCKCGTGLCKDEEIAFHKGCLTTLSSERNELFKMLQNVEAIMQAHIQKFQELGVRIDTE